MNTWFRALAMFSGAVAMLVFPGCARYRVVSEPTDLIGDVTPVVPAVSAPADQLDPLWEHTPAFDPVGMHSGDLVGDAEPELVLVGASRVEILDTEGSVVRAFELPPPQAVDGFLADVDGDGKLDIVVGSAGDVTSRVRVVNAQGAVILEGTHGGLVNGYTRPAFESGGYIYFTAGSTFRSTPRVTGRLEIRSREIEWVRLDGVVPMGLAYSRALDVLAVHNRGVSRDLDGAPGWRDSPPERSAVLTSTPAGETRVFAPQGGAVLEGAGGLDQFTSVYALPFDAGAGGAGAIAVAGRGSALYEGAAEIVIVDGDGSVVRRRPGPTSTSGRLALLDRRGGPSGDEPSIVVGWNSAGVVEVFDPSLDLVSSTALPGASHDLTLEAVIEAASFRDVRIVVRDQDRLGLISPADGLLALYRFDGEIRHVDVVTRQTEHRLAVFTRRVRVFALRAAQAAPRPLVDLAVPGLRSAPIPADGLEERVVGELSGPALTARARLPDASRVAYLGSFNVTGDDRPELVFRVVNEDRIILRDERFEWVGSFVLPERALSLSVVDDLDGDKLSDIAFVTDDEFAASMAVRGDGSVISRVGFSFLFDSVVYPQRAHEGLLLLPVTTGHMEWPRGLYGVDAARGAVRFFYPIAAFVNTVVAHDGAFYVSNYTPDNGAVIERPDGSVDTDGAMFLHAINRDGSIHPYARPIDLGEPRGMLNFFLWDADGDGSEDVHAIVRRSAPYNPGLSGVYRLADGGRLIRVIEGSHNSQSAPHVVRIGSRDHLVLRWSDRDDVLVYGPRYELVGAFAVQTPGLASVVDANRDGVPELLSIRDGALVYRDTATGGEQRIRSQDGPFRTVRVHEVRGREYVAVAHGDAGYFAFHLGMSGVESLR